MCESACDWIGGYCILTAFRRLYLEPHLDKKYLLSRRKRSRHEQVLR